MPLSVSLFLSPPRTPDLRSSFSLSPVPPSTSDLLETAVSPCRITETMWVELRDSLLTPVEFHARPGLLMLYLLPFIYIGYRVFRFVWFFWTWPIFRTLFAFLQAVFVYIIAPFFYEPDLKKFENRWTGERQRDRETAETFSGHWWNRRNRSCLHLRTGKKRSQKVCANWKKSEETWWCQELFR